MVLFTGRAYGMASTKGWTDHAYVRTEQGDFDCFGGTSGEGDRAITSGQGNFDIANCYRGRKSVLGGTHDTACIGNYVLDGFCHQAANCFLRSAGATLNLHVRGYFLTVFLCGYYGGRFPQWRDKVYKRCGGAGFTDPLPPGLTAHDQPDRAFLARVDQIIADTEDDPDESIVLQTAALVEHFAPDVDPQRFSDLQRQHLREKDEIAAEQVTGERLAAAMNELGYRAQDQLAETLGSRQFEALNAVPPGEPTDLVEPGLEELAGRRLVAPPGAPLPPDCLG